MKNTSDNVVDFEPHDYDNQAIAVMKRILNDKSNCIDVGCNVGAFFDVILKLSPNGTHLAFEPIPDLCRTLKDRYSRYSNVAIYSCALSDTTGEMSFQHVTTNKAYSGLKKRRYDRPNESIEEIKVHTERLDNIIPKDYHVSFMKIDVEGAELQVLRGAIHTIRKYKPLIVFEHGLGAADYYGTTPGDVYDLLTNECGLHISLMTDWMKGGDVLTRQAFSDQFNSGSNYYFMAHKMYT